MSILPGTHPSAPARLNNTNNFKSFCYTYVEMANALHHQSLRKRVHSKRQKYPHPNKFIAWFDKLIILVGILNAVATIPQVLQIWIGQDASGVSVVSWSYYAFGSVMFLLYGIIHKEIPIIVNYSAAMVLYILIVLGTLMYS